MGKILVCVITTHEGRVYTNELMLSEARIVSQMAQENRKVEVTCIEVTDAQFKSIFG